jgi:hypothetical protein
MGGRPPSIASMALGDGMWLLGSLTAPWTTLWSWLSLKPADGSGDSVAVHEPLTYAGPAVLPLLSLYWLRSP